MASSWMYFIKTILMPPKKMQNKTKKAFYHLPKTNCGCYSVWSEDLLTPEVMGLNSDYLNASLLMAGYLLCYILMQDKM